MDLTTIARKVFASDLYATKATGITIDHVDEQEVVCSLQLTEMHRNAKGAVMGGVIFTLADFAFAIAANSSILANSNTSPQLAWVSTSSTIHYLTTAKGDQLFANTRPIKQGKSQALFQTTVTDSEKRTIALIVTSGTKLTS